MDDKEVENVARRLLYALEDGKVPRAYWYKVSMRVCLLAHQQKLSVGEATIAVFRSLIAAEDGNIYDSLHWADDLRLYQDSEFWVKVAEAVNLDVAYDWS